METNSGAAPCRPTTSKQSGYNPSHNELRSHRIDAVQLADYGSAMRLDANFAGKCGYVVHLP